jgi:RND family efflux transporter MFP subunit
MRRIWWLIPFLSVLPGALAAQGFPAPAVETAQVIQLELAPTMWAPGTVVSRNDARIAAEIPGRITWIAEPGEHFAAGEVLATIDNQALKIGLAQQQAEIGQLEARLTFNEQELERLQKLTRQNSASRTQLDGATADRQVAVMQLAGARAVRDRLNFDLQRTTVIAPFGGQWVERHQQTGEYTAIGATLGRLVDTTHKEVRARAPINVAPYLDRDMKLVVKADQQTVTQPVRAIIPVGDEVSRSLEIRVLLEEPAPLVGSAVRVAVPTAFPEVVLAVPRDALVIRQEANYVFRIVEGSAEQVEVKIGNANIDLIAVTGNLAAGDEVVVRGAERLRDAQSVRVIGRREQDMRINSDG